MKRGYGVTCADIEFTSLVRARETAQARFIHDVIDCIQLDAKYPLPFRDESFDMLLVIHFTHPGLIPEVVRTLRPDGLLIYETFGAHGQNWLQLPSKRELEEELMQARMELLRARFKAAGPQGEVVTAKIFARKVKQQEPHTN